MEKQENQTATNAYFFETKVRYSECDANGQARLSSVLDYLQDVCIFQAEALSIGIHYMEAHQTAWILNSWQADIVRYPILGEKIKITTWPYDFNGFYGFRNFKIEDESGAMLLRANSVWVFMNLQKGRPVRIAPEVIAAYKLEKQLDMEYMERKIPDFDAEPTQAPMRRISRNFIDTNQHVNNVKYVMLAEELLPPDFEAVRFRAEYRKSAVYGDILYPFYIQQSNCLSVKLSDKDGNTCVRMEFYKK